jgi:hypothetical protein
VSVLVLAGLGNPAIFFGMETALSATHLMQQKKGELYHPEHCL